MATSRDYDELVRKYIDPKVEDNVYNATPLLRRLKAKAKVRNLADWHKLPLEVAEGIGGPMHDLDTIDRSRKEITDYSYWQLKEYYCVLTVSKRDRLICSGAEDVVDLLQAKARNAQKKMRKELTSGIVSDGTTNTKHFVGLQRAIPDTTSDDSTAYGNITGSTDTWWNPQHQNKSSTALTYPDIVNMKAACEDGDDTPTCLYTDKFIKADIWGRLLQPQERYNDGGKIKTADGLDVVAGIPILTDAAFESDGETGGRIYFVNEKYLRLWIHSKDNFKYWPFMLADDQFAYSAKWTLSGFYACTNRKRQGLIYGISV